MNDQLNGNQHIPPDAQQQSAQASAILNQITPPIRAALQTVIRGILTGYEGVPAHVLLQVVAFEVAYYSGQALQSDIATTLQLRGQFKKAFEDGFKKVPMQAPMMPGAPGYGS
jgi:hypothetical protein